MLEKVGVTVGGYVVAGVLGLMLFNAHEKIGAEREACNTRAETAAREAVEAVKNAQLDAYEAEIANIEQRLAEEREARQIAQDAALAAENRPERVRTIIRETASADACIYTAVPDAVIRGLRD